ncbi:endonuclease III [Bdellovibrionota bacterium FG-2]
MIRLQRILALLEQNYPEAQCSLNFETPFELLVATILSAQCTDKRVNLVTPLLFARFPTIREMASARISVVERVIHSTGFYKNKAKSIVAAAKKIMADHGGEVPETLAALVQLPGVGRKTANVVLGSAFGVPSLVVDTHVGRLCRRLGFTVSSDPVKIEAEMEKLVPRSKWSEFSHLLIFHGREICKARRPLCTGCCLSRNCPKVGVPQAMRL